MSKIGSVLLLFLSLFGSTMSYAQDPEYQWGFSIHAQSDVLFENMFITENFELADDDGNFYISYKITQDPRADIDPFINPGNTFEDLHTYVFAKYSTDGELLWHKTFQNIGSNLAISVSETDNSVTIAARNIDRITSGDDITVISYLPDGTEKWRILLGTEERSINEELDLDARFGYIFLCGIAAGHLHPFPDNNNTAKSNISLDGDIFFTKISETGVVQYIQVLSSPNSFDPPARIVSTTDGEAVLTGSLRDMNMNPDDLGPAFNLSTPNGSMQFIGYYTDSGELIHAIALTEEADFPFTPDIVYSPRGFIWIGSNAREDIRSTTNGPVHPKMGYNDVILGKYSLNASLDVEEFYRFSHADSENGNHCHTIDLDPNDNLYVMGRQSTDFLQYDPTGNRPPEPKQAYYNTFLAIYSPSFELQYVGLRSQNGWHGEINELQVGKNNDLYLHEDFEWDHDFSFKEGEEHILPYSGDGSRQMALIKYTVDFCYKEDLTVRDTSACDSLVLGNQTYYNSGMVKDTIVLPDCNEIRNYNLTIHPSYTMAATLQNSCKSFTWHGDTYTQSGVYSKTLMTTNGCDSVVFLNLAIDTIMQPVELHTMCEEQNYVWAVNGQSYTTGGTYTYTNSSGICDTTFTLELTTLPVHKDTTTLSHCGPYTWPETNVEYSSSGLYTTTYTHPITGCDSSLTLDLTVHPTYAATRTVEACETYFWAISGEDYLNDTIVSRTLTSQLGCDSVETLELTIHRNQRAVQVATACNEFYWAETDSLYLQTGLDSITYPDQNGCDSTLVLNLVVDEDYCNRLDTNHCFGTPFIWEFNNLVYNQTGLYRDTLPNSLGGDSIAVLNLVILDTSVTHFSHTACDTYFWEENRVNYTSSTTDTVFLTNQEGCDSLVILHLIVNPSSTTEQFVSNCGNEYTWSETGATYSNSGRYSISYLNQYGCDSTVFLNLTLLPIPETNVAVTECNTYQWAENGLTYTSSTQDTVVHTAQNGCDSLVILSLTLHHDEQSSLSVDACDSYLWSANNTTYGSSGSYQHTFSTIHGCDSVVTLNLTILESTSSTTTLSACNAFTWDANNTTYSASGTYYTTISNAAGCDSSLTLNLTVHSSFESHSTQVNCNQAYTWPENGNTYSSSGTYTQVYTDQNGCDSTYFLHFTNYIDNPVTEDVSACISYYWPHTQQTYTTSGTYSTTLTNQLGCDSVARIALSIHQPSLGEESVERCYGYSWPTNGQYYGQSGDYTAVIQNQYGCDSTVTLHLTIHDRDRTPVSATSCDSYYWSETDQTYTSSGVYEHELKNQHGCDSTIELSLTILNSPRTTLTETACATGYYWANTQTTYQQSGTYRDTLGSANGCDSIVELELTVLPESQGTDVVAECVSYFWPTSNLTYTQSGTDSVHLVNSHGCDSVAFLDLTIFSPSNHTIVASSCGSYFWNQTGTNYTETGTYSDTLNNQFGCDSVVELDLTIHPIPAPTIETYGACMSFVSPHTGTSYSASGVYTETLQTVAGCDSLIELHITIDQPFSDSHTTSSCGQYIWHVTSDTLTQSGQYEWHGQTQNACDSSYYLDLTIYPNYYFFDTVVACENYIWSEDGLTYTESGNYQIIHCPVTGCDSTYNLNLTIQQPDTLQEYVANCESYSWTKSGETYYTSGRYEYLQSGNALCDSLFVLDLTILEPDSTTIDVLACASYYWESADITITSSGEYQHLLLNQDGCDSLLLLNARIENDTITSESITACESFFWAEANEHYAQSGTYTHTFTTLAGCDSTANLHLTIHNGGSSYQDTLLCNRSYYFEPTRTYLEESGNYTFTLPNPVNGCDSLVEIDFRKVDTRLSYQMDLEGIYLDPTITVVDWLKREENTGEYHSTTETSTTLEYPENGVYKVLYEYETCLDSVLIRYDQFNCDPPFFAPNAMSPNADDINDVFQFKFKGCPVQSFSITIFDRWGNELFYSTDPGFEWDGTFNGKKMRPGSYPYKATYQISENKKRAGEFVGSVVLVN